VAGDGAGRGALERDLVRVGAEVRARARAGVRVRARARARVRGGLSATRGAEA
jgi:hypothetical protein